MTDKQSRIFVLDEPKFYPMYYVEYWIESGYILMYEVYPCNEVEYHDGSKHTHFEARHDSNGYEFFDKDHILCVMTGHFRWHGVWDNRIYFPDGNEYRDTEFIELADFYEEKLDEWGKDICRKLQPELNYHGE